MTLLGLIVFVVIFGASLLGIELFRRLSLARGWVDIPNERSSHNIPIPRGAGAVIVILSLVVFVLVNYFLSSAFYWGYLAGAVLVSLISWFDDRYSMSYLSRLVTHLIAASLVVFSVGGFQFLGIQNVGLAIGLLKAGISIVWIAWMINAFNFMDGIDGLAGTQATISAGAWAIAAFQTGLADIGYLSLSLAGACLGFLVYNWSPARVFMGDVGSAFLGFTFGAMPFLFTREFGRVESWIPVAGVLFVWPFLFDAIVTRLRRLFRGEAFWRPNREHLYQLLVIAGYSHWSVSLLYGSFAIVVCAIVFLFNHNVADLRILLPGLFISTISFLLVVIWLKRLRLQSAVNDER